MILKQYQKYEGTIIISQTNQNEIIAKPNRTKTKKESNVYICNIAHIYL